MGGRVVGDGGGRGKGNYRYPTTWHHLTLAVPTREQPEPAVVAPANVHWLPELPATDRDTQKPDLCHATATSQEDSTAAHRERVVSDR